MAGSHKPNTAVPQAWYNAQEGVRKLSTETGAGQWGSALAFACGVFGLECEVWQVRPAKVSQPCLSAAGTLSASIIQMNRGSPHKTITTYEKNIHHLGRHSAQAACLCVLATLRIVFGNCFAAGTPVTPPHGGLVGCQARSCMCTEPRIEVRTRLLPCGTRRCTWHSDWH